MRSLCCSCNYLISNVCQFHHHYMNSVLLPIRIVVSMHPICFLPTTSLVSSHLIASNRLGCSIFRFPSIEIPCSISVPFSSFHFIFQPAAEGEEAYFIFDIIFFSSHQNVVAMLCFCAHRARHKLRNLFRSSLSRRRRNKNAKPIYNVLTKIVRVCLCVFMRPNPQLNRVSAHISPRVRCACALEKCSYFMNFFNTIFFARLLHLHRFCCVSLFYMHIQYTYTHTVLHSGCGSTSLSISLARSLLSPARSLFRSC